MFSSKICYSDFIKLVISKYSDLLFIYVVRKVFKVTIHFKNLVGTYSIYYMSHL